MALYILVKSREALFIKLDLNYMKRLQKIRARDFILLQFDTKQQN